MTAPAEVCRAARRVVVPQCSTVQVNTLRALLVATRREQTARSAGHQATLAALVANLSADISSRDRAMAALHVYCAPEAIEEVENTHIRIDDGGSGFCQSHDPPLPMERVEAIPQAGFGSSPERKANRDGATI